ncbi:MAG: peptidoglycan DD-metalloendopeptidase family protein [Lachnospiraceae bacterium]|nr:peptidoglycan DD-metalloendopeptidase family protein [Lachnospiraceae bacterium]
MKKWKITGCLILAVALLCTAGEPRVCATNMSEITSESIREMESQIDNAQSERDQLKNSLSDIKKLVQQLEQEKKDLKGYVAKLDENMALIEQKIADFKMQIANKEADIEEAQRQLEHALEVEANQYETMSSRIKFSYERGENYLLEMLMGSTSFADFLNRSYYMEQVADFDNQMLESFIQTREYVELCKAQLEQDKAFLDEAKEGVENEQAALEELMKQKQQELNAYDQRISSGEQSIEEYEADLKAQNELISALEKAVEDEKKRILASSGKVLTYDGGTFKFPLASYTRVSDDYGMRMHPTLFVQQFHNGVDFASPKGTAIYAAYDGIVVAADYSSTMGNYVMIDHGGGLYTIYMHASKLYVKKDDVVARGNTIAAVGSTGRSTGNHLHFSVRLDGEYVSPWNYISP